MKNLAINIPNVNDVTSFYRASNPLANLRERCSNLVGLQPGTVSESSMRMCDGAFFQRPFLNDHRGAIEMAKDSGIKVWVDYDDYLLDVPTDNPTQARYMEKNIQDNVKWILQNVDIITVSTEHLKQLLLPYNKNIKVAPNAVDMRLARFKERPKPVPRSKIIAWRGSNTHQRDVFTYAGQVIETSRAKEAIDWQWHFIGDTLWFLTDSMPHTNTFITRPMPSNEFLKHIEALAPSAFHVPLFDCDFNRAKSNIAWLEASFAGAVCIGPDWQEWHHPGVLLYRDADEYKQALQAVLMGMIDVQATAKISWDYIQETLTLEKVNDVRIEVLCELFECSKADLGVK